MAAGPGEVQDLSRAKKFFTSADLREKMEESGVVDKPDIRFLDSWSATVANNALPRHQSGQ